MSATLAPAVQRVGGTLVANGAGAPPLVRGGLSSLYANAVFWYAANFAFTTGSETLTVNIPIQSDAHFMCLQSMGDNSAAVNTTGQTLPTILQGGGVVLLQDGAAQRFLTSIAVPLSSVFGNAREPYIWPMTHIFRANGFIGVQITGAGATMASSTFRAVFAGIKIPINSRPDLGL